MVLLTVEFSIVATLWLSECGIIVMIVIFEVVLILALQGVVSEMQSKG